MAKTLKATPTSSPKLVALPPLSQLFRDSWDRLKLVGWRVFALYVLMSVVIGGIFVIGLLGGGAATLGAGGFSNIQATLMNPATWLSLGLLFVVLLVIVSLLANAFTAALIMAVDEGAKRTPLRQLVNHGFQLIIPLFVVSFVTQFLVMGGLFLFVIPGIVIGVLLSFAMYEVILGNVRGMAALKNSVSIVSQNFWGILGRWAALIGLQMVVTLVLGALADGESAGSAVFELLSSIFSLFFGIYTLVYGVLLYRAARANTNLAEGKMTWMWPVALLGWVVGGALLFAVAQIARSAYNEVQNNPDAFDSWMQESGEMTGPGESSMYDDSSEMMLDSGAYGALYEELMQDGELSDEDLTRLYQEALQLQEQPLE